MVSVPVDDVSLGLLETALEWRIVSVDEEGNPVGSGEFSLNRLLNLWSGYDPALEEVDEDNPHITVYRGGPVLSSKDVMLALIAEVRRLRALDSAELN